jgi:hypothetical protein
MLIRAQLPVLLLLLAPIIVLAASSASCPVSSSAGLDEIRFVIGFVRSSTFADLASCAETSRQSIVVTVISLKRESV